MAVGVDLCEDGRKYTFAVADTGGYSGESKGDSASLICFTQEGRNIDDAVDKLNRKLSKKLSFSHLSALVFSDYAARSDMYDEVSYLEKKISVRPQTMIAVANESSESYLKTLKPDLEANPEKYFQNVFSKNESYVSTLRLSDFTNSYHGKTTAFAPLIKMRTEADKLSEEDTYISGSALIIGGKMTALIEDNWVMGLIHTKKTVNYDGIRCKSVKNAVIDVNTDKVNPRADIYLKVNTNKKASSSELEKNMEVILTEYASKGIDIADVVSHAKKNFVLQRDYENYDFDIKNTEFNVNAQIVVKEDEDDI